MYLLLLLLFIICTWLFVQKLLSKYLKTFVSRKGRVFLVGSLVVLLALSFGLYLKFDKKGYEYGLGCAFCNSTIPYRLEPKIDQYYSLVLLDRNGFELVSGGFKYTRSTFKIKNFLAYGYNDTSIVVKCTDSVGTMKYLTSYEIGDKDKQEISFKDLNNKNFDLIKHNYKWFEVNEEVVSRIRLLKLFCFVGGVLSTCFIITLLYSLKKTRG